MSNEVKQEILSHQLSCGVFENAKPDFSEGIAQKAVDTSYDTLSPKQQAVLEPFLTHKCCGVTNPGEHHNNCQVVLEENSLLDAYTLSDDNESLQCESCRQEAFDYAAEWERIQGE